MSVGNAIFTDTIRINGIANANPQNIVILPIYPVNDGTKVYWWSEGVPAANADCVQMFKGCQALEDCSSLGGIDFSICTNMREMFYQCYALTSTKGFDTMDVSNVENMYGLFNNARNLVDISELSSWNTSKVTTFFSLFCNTKISDISGLSGCGTPILGDPLY